MQRWVTFQFHESVEAAIEQWYYASTPAQEMRGDMACADFASEVRLQLVEEDAVACTVDVRELDPYHHALTIFYRVDMLLRCVDVLGALRYDVLMARHGKVTSALLVEHGQSRAALVPEAVPMVAESEDAPPLQLPFAVEQQQLEAEEVDVLEMDLEPLLCWYTLMESGEGTVMEIPHWAVASQMMALVGACIEHEHGVRYHSQLEARVLRQRYELMRREAEERALESVLVHSSHTQRALIRLLAHNNLTPWLRENSVRPTARDLQMFHACYREPAFIPTVFIRVPVQHVPPARARALPMYHGGYVNLPCYWDALRDWLWQRRMAEAQRFHAEWDHTRWSEFRRDYPEHAARVAAATHDMVKWMYAHVSRVNLSLDKKERSVRPIYSSSRSGEQKTVQVQSETVTVDLEDLWKALPPCVAELRDTRFPKHITRLQLNPILYEAGVSQQTAHSFYDHLNARFPRGGQQLLERYPFPGEWQRVVGKGVTYCNAIIRATFDGRSDSLRCPFVASHGNGEVPGKVLNRRCYEACSPSNSFFGGRPALLLSGRLAHLKSAREIRPEAAAEEEQEAMFTETSSSSDGEEKW